jgi:sialidase-1
VTNAAFRTLAIVACFLAIGGSRIFSADAGLSKATLFEAGHGGYAMYRIPGIIVTKKGTVLVYNEARRNSGSDWSTIDIVMRRSTDGGATFSPARVIARAPFPVRRNPVAIERKQGNASDVTYNNPVAIAGRDGTVHFLFCAEYMRVFYMRSADDGRTFTAPVEITNTLDALKQAYPWRVVATGPGHGIELSNGRLVVPIWLSLGTQGNGHAPSQAATIYSDDHGLTWQAGEIAVPDTSEFPSPNEAEAVELEDGRVMLNVRCAAKENRRVIVESKDGASDWSAPRFQEDLPDPICFASILLFPRATGSGKNRLIFSNPDNLTRTDGKDVANKDRKNLTVRLSYDEGKTWPVKKSLEPGASGYSDLAALPDGTILCYYEMEAAEPGASHKRSMVLARFNMQWLTSGEGRDP